MSEQVKDELQVGTYKRQFSEANSRAKNLTFRLSALQDRFDKHVDYSIDLARIIESLAKGRDIVAPQILPNIHYGMAIEALALHRDMVGALRTAEKIVGREFPNGQGIIDIRAAIAKAEGRS